MHRVVHQQLLPHRMQETLSCCPNYVARYAMLHLDTIGKIVNHILAFMVIMNTFLLFSSFSVAATSNLGGVNAVFCSFMLFVQMFTVWSILNNNNQRIASLSFLAPTEFMIGVALGITVGAAILALVCASAFRNVAHCSAVTSNGEQDPAYEYACTQRKGGMMAVWFWSSILFWLNFWLSLLLTIGRHELATSQPQHHYETIGEGDQASSAPAFVGDYANVPEIRTEQDALNVSSHSTGSHSKRMVASLTTSV
jgi:hypothetical protein